MKTILIDDEKPALLQLERLLKANGRIEVVGKFTSAKAGLEHLANEMADLVFLDIGMPEINGLEAAKLIQQLDNRIRIVYVTAYSDYAIEAFELHALDYLLKPINPARFAKTMARIERELTFDREKEPVRTDSGNAMKVLFFKKLEWQDLGQARKDLKWRTEKAQELFAYLLYFQGEWIPKDILLEKLWTDYPQDKATTALHTSISQIRKLLKESGSDTAIEYTLGKYRLAGAKIVTDVALLESMDPEESVKSEESWERVDRILLLYRGHYLEEHDYDWAIPIRERLLHRYEQHVVNITKYEVGAGRVEGAIRRLCALQELRPYSGKICNLLLVAYAQNQDYEGMRNHYKSFVKLLQDDLGVEPDRQTKESFERLHRVGASE